MEDQWLHWAKRLQAIASTGLHFSAADYDQERYAEVGEIAQLMLSALGEIPLQRIQSLVPDFARGYATPKVDVRGAVFDGERVLLVQERTDGLWTLPGGYADVGLSGAENVVKEVAEEAGLEVRARQLYAVRHKAKHGYRPDTRDFYKFFYICEQLQNAPPQPGLETLAADFFPLDNLPQLSTGRVIAADIAAAFKHRDDPRRMTSFD